MSFTYKPAHYNSVSAYLAVDGAQGTIDFLKYVFGAEELRRHEYPDGRLGHAEVRIDDSVIMIADATEDWPAIPAHMHIYVPDVDVAYGRALEFGARSVQLPQQRDGEGDKRGGVRDAGGTTWWIGTQVEE